MTRPSRLYFRSPGASRRPELVAEHYCSWRSLPVLWQLLLAAGADGSVRPCLAGEHALPTATIDTPALAAIARIDLLRELVMRHPLIHRLPQLPVLIEGIAGFLRMQLNRFPATEQARVMLVAQLGEADEETSIAEALARCADLWRDLQTIDASGQLHQLDAVLGFARKRMHIAQWYAWSRFSGLATFSHPYFERLEYEAYAEAYEDAPATSTFADYCAHHGADDTHADEEQDEHYDEATEPRVVRLWRILCGLGIYLGRRMRGMNHEQAMEPAEDANDDVDDNAHDGSDECAHAHAADLLDQWRHTGLYPTGDDSGRVGLNVLEVVDEQYRLGAVVVPPVWDEIAHPQYETAWARRGSRWSLIATAPAYAIVLEDCCDAVISYDHSDAACIVRDGGKFGVIDSHNQRWLAPATHDAIKCDDDGGASTWRVRRSGLWGMIDDDGNTLLDCSYDSIEADLRGFPYTQLGWRVMKAGRCGWVTREGAWAVSCDWDDIRPSHGKGLYAVMRDARWGVVAAGDVTWVPPVYLDAEPAGLALHLTPPPDIFSFIRDTAWPDEPVPDFIAPHDPAQANVLIVVGTEHGAGMVDQANRSLIPCIYRSVTVAATSSFQDPRWACVVDHDGRHGLWDTVGGAWCLPCAHDWLEVITTPDMEPVVVTIDAGQCRVVHMDGRPVFDGAFRWIVSENRYRDSLMDLDCSRRRAEKIADAWVVHEPVQAALIVDGAPDIIVLLQPGRPVRPQLEVLEQAWRDGGDVLPAYTLAMHYRYGDGTERDDVQARIWAARACGHDPLLPGAPGHMQAVSGDDVEDYTLPFYQRMRVHGQRRALRDAHTESCWLFASMLDEGLGGPRDPVRARVWAEAAVQRQGLSRSNRAVTLLARLYLDPAAGPVDPERVHLLLDDVDDGDASYLRALLYRDGAGVEQDWEAARELFMRADAAGVPAATGALAALLRQMAAMGGAQPLLAREASYYQAKADALCADAMP